MRRLWLLPFLAALYVMAAWLSVPGFYDGFAPQQPYNWVSPPPQFVATNAPPKTGAATLKLTNGESDPGDVFTDDNQFDMSFLPGAFDTSNGQPVSLTITPVSTYPPPTGLHVSTNVYCLTSTSKLKRSSTVTLIYSTGIPAPSAVYEAESQTSGSWISIGTDQPSPFSIAGHTPSIGCFMAAWQLGSSPAGSITIGGGQTLPLIVGGVIVLLLLAGLPLVISKRAAAPSTSPPRKGPRKSGSGIAKSSPGSRKGK